MRRVFSKLAFLLVLSFLSDFADAQLPKYTAIHFQSGDFFPTKNFKALSNNASSLRTALLQGIYYVVIQFNAIPTANTRTILKKQGIELIDYIPTNAYTAIIPESINWIQLASAQIRSVFQLDAKQKSSHALYNSIVPSHAQILPGFFDLTVITFDRLQVNAIQPYLANLGATLIDELPAYKTFIVRVPASRVRDFVELPFILWADFIDEPNKEENLPGRTQHRVNVLAEGSRNLQGDGINVGIWDGGAIGSHLDFFPIGRVTQVENVGSSAHSTHCAGTILGRGLIDPFARGMAPNAQLFSYDFNGNVPNEIAAAIPTFNLAVSSHSYGGSATCGVNAQVLLTLVLVGQLILI